MKLITEAAHFRRARAQWAAFTLMEILVVVAIIIVIAAIAFPVYARIKAGQNKGVAFNTLRQLGSTLNTYIGQNDGTFPAEDADGADTWENASRAGNEKVWYNALPTLMGSRSVADFVRSNNPAAFYTKENVLWLPGAQYSEGKKLQKPLFAIAINGKLQRKDKDGKKAELKLANVINPGRTVAFLEQGLPGEERAHPAQSKKLYDGSAKGSARTFVARYTGIGILAFVDGHAEEVKADQILTASGDTLWQENFATENPSAIFWTGDPKEDPNSTPQ